MISRRRLGWPVELDAHQVVLLALVPVGGRPDRDDAVHRLAVVQEDLQRARGRAAALADVGQVVDDCEPGGGGGHRLGRAPAAGAVDVAAALGAVVAGHVLAVAEVVDGGHGGQEVLAVLVAQVAAGVEQALAARSSASACRCRLRARPPRRARPARPRRRAPRRSRLRLLQLVGGRDRPPGSSSGSAAGRPRPPPAAAGSRARARPPGRSCRRPAGSRSWRTCRRSSSTRPSPSPTWAAASGRRPGAAAAPSCATRGRTRSSGRPGAARSGTPRRRSGRCRSAARAATSSRWRSRRGRSRPARSSWTTSTPSPSRASSASRTAPGRRRARPWRC